MAQSQSLRANALALLISNAGSAALSFVLSVLIGRVLGEDGLGIYAAALAWVFPLSIISEFGIGTLITRDVAQNLALSHAYLRTSITARLIIGGVLMALLFLIAPFLSASQAVVDGLRVSAPLILIFPLYGGFTAIFRAHQVMLPVAVLNLGMLIAQLSLTWLTLNNGGDIQALFVVNTLTSLGQMMAAGMVYRWRFLQPSPTTIALTPLLKRGMPFAIAAVLGAIQIRLVFILLEQFGTLAAVGYFAAAWRFMEAGRMLPHALFDAIFPRLSALAQDASELRRSFRRLMTGLVIYGAMTALILFMVSRALIQWTYGVNFAPAASILQILGVALLFTLLKNAQILYAYARGREQRVNGVTVLMIGLQIGLGYALIREHGANGAAATLLISEAIAFMILRLWSR